MSALFVTCRERAMVYNGPRFIMTKSTHFIFGNYFYSYGVEFWGLFFKMALADKPVYNARRFGTVIVRHKTYDEYRELNTETMAEDIRKPISERSIFTKTTKQHFDYYMDVYFGIPNAFSKLVKYLKTH